MGLRRGYCIHRRWCETDGERPMQKLNDLSRSLTPLDPDGTLFRGSTRPDHWRVWSWHFREVPHR
jgi:hypothetical protein